MKNRIRRYFFPTFQEWLGDFNKGLNKELENPKVRELILKIYSQTK
jgi:hypothetical protein